jgi:hypothetical protein
VVSSEGNGNKAASVFKRWAPEVAACAVPGVSKSTGSRNSLLLGCCGITVMLLIVRWTQAQGRWLWQLNWVLVLAAFRASKQSSRGGLGKFSNQPAVNWLD